MKCPKVEFIHGNVKKDAAFFDRMISEKNKWSKIIYKLHPKLKGLLKGAGKESIRPITVNYLKEEYVQRKDAVEDAIKEYSAVWKPYNDRFMRVLEEVMETKWNKNVKICKAYVSLNPISPRYLKDSSFSIYYIPYFKGKQLSARMKVLDYVPHELTHFLYFKKFKEIFPEIKERKYDYPYIEWRLSEILAPIILRDERIVKTLDFKAELETYATKSKYLNLFNMMYKKHLRSGNGFEVFLENAYAKAKELDKDLIQNY